MNSGVLLHNLIRQKIITFNQRAEITTSYIDAVSKEAVQLFVEICADLAQINDRVEEDLRVLRNDKFSLELDGYDNDIVYYKYPKDFFRFNLLYGTIKKGSIKKRLKLQKVRASEENSIQDNSNFNASFTWGRAPYALVSRGIKVYRGNLDIEAVYADYYRKPIMPKFAAVDPNGIYIDLQGDFIDYSVEMDLTENYQLRRISDIVAILIERDFLGAGKAVERMSNIKNIENLFK